MNIHLNIRKIRETEKSFTQKYMADCLGITTKAYSNIENGVTDLTIKRICQIAEIFECEPMYILLYDNKTSGIINNFRNESGNQGVNIMNQYTESQKILHHYQSLLDNANIQIDSLLKVIAKLKD